MPDAEIQALLDKQEIREVIYRYCRGIDRLDEDLIRSVYHPGATDNHLDFFGSGEEFAAYVVPTLRDAYEATQHFIGNLLIDLDGDTARCETYFIATHVSRGNEAAKGHMVAGGRYVDRFERRDGRWLIADRVVLIDWTRIDSDLLQFEIGEHAQGRQGADDLVYAR